MIEQKEESKEEHKNELYVRMREIVLAHRKTIGDEFKFVRGKGLVKRD